MGQKEQWPSTQELAARYPSLDMSWYADMRREFLAGWENALMERAEEQSEKEGEEGDDEEKVKQRVVMPTVGPLSKVTQEWEVEKRPVVAVEAIGIAEMYTALVRSRWQVPTAFKPGYVERTSTGSIRMCMFDKGFQRQEESAGDLETQTQR